MKRLLFTSTFLLSILLLKGQTGELYENANAILKDYSAVYTQTDLNNATYKVSKTITILNKQGEDFGHFFTYGDKFTELKDFSGVIKNSAGTVVRKISKKDLTISSISEHLSTDDYRIVYKCKHPTYPYTVEYTYQQRIKNGIISYPPFTPVNDYLQSVEQASYTIQLPADVKIRYRSNFDCDIEEGNENGKQTYTFSVRNLKAIDSEPQAPPFKEIVPHVLIAPTDFCYDSKCGNMSDWKSYGKWVSTLLEGRDALSPDFVGKLKELIKDAKTDREKVKILYKYMQDNTRYVSIQLGIGGLQPIDAISTSKSKFGDCKGLTNLTKAMLNAVGIKSNYCEIYSGSQKYLHRDFTNVTQTNHVILMVPLQNDTIWLECTDPTAPFGYIHDRIAGHDALVITDDGGKICRLPTYSDQQNKKETKLLINISEDGTAKGNITFVEHLVGYDYTRSYIMSNDREKMVMYINGNVNMPKLQLGKINNSEEKSDLPFCSLTSDYEAPDFANKTGTRLFLAICPLKKNNYNIFSASKRSLDIYLSQGFSESDSIIINIPESYTHETLPKDISLETDFGTFSTQCTVEGNKIVYTQNTDIFSGRYSKDRYKEVKDFFGEISSAIKRKIVLKKI